MIIRTPDRSRYVIISKVPLEDNRLSWKAKGMLAYLLSKPDGWKVIVSHLVAQTDDGRTTVRACLKELEGAGYIVKTTREKVKGRYDGLDVDVLEEPRETPDRTGGQNSPRNRGRFTDAVERPLVNNELVNNELVNKEADHPISQPTVEQARANARRARDILRSRT